MGCSRNTTLLGSKNSKIYILLFLCFDLLWFFTGRSLGAWYILVSVLLASALCGLVQQGVLLRMGFRARTWTFVSIQAVRWVPSLYSAWIILRESEPTIGSGSASTSF